jgi:alpha-galactosidase
MSLNRNRRKCHIISNMKISTRKEIRNIRFSLIWLFRRATRRRTTPRVVLSACALVIFFALIARPARPPALAERTAGAGTDSAHDEILAATPPMGWNSWDSYGESVSEADIRANAQVMARRFKTSGWQYIVVDMGWYVTNHSAGTNSTSAQFSLDKFGRFTPAANSFPSAANGEGFKPLADYVHSLGLKFGIHILRGIPRLAVKENLPIADSAFHAADAADTSDTCPWNAYNFGVDASKPAARAYYESILKLYASWGVDFLKVDCIASGPYKGEDIRMIADAIQKTGRPIVLSLSPGPAPLEHADTFERYAQMWRISDDVWDIWYGATHFPQGPGNQFARTAAWEKYSGPGHWPDADMLPIGRLEPSAGWGQPRATRLTREEQRTLITLWSIFRSPLIMGGNLTRMDNWTASLQTNPEVLAVDQHSRENHAAIDTKDAAAWLARAETGDDYYLALFNLKDRPQTLAYSWKELGLNGSQYKLRDLWERKNIGRAASVSASLAPHASVLYRLSPQ